MKLMIIESPGKIARLSAILGEGWKVVATMGPVLDLPHNDMGVEAPGFWPAYALTPHGTKVIAKLRRLIKKAEEVYFATDPDREGESASWLLQRCLNLADPQRLTLSEITTVAVKSALLQPETINAHRVAAQEAKQVLDRLVAYLVGPELRRQFGRQLSVGRLQGPALRMVVELEQRIRRHKKADHFGAVLHFGEANIQAAWVAEWLTNPQLVTEPNPPCVDGTLAADVAAVRSVVVKSVTEEEIRRGPPPPFTTSTLLQAASVVFGLDPRVTMEVAQQLYEQGHITYHRTDSPNVSRDALGDIYAAAVGRGLDMPESPRMFKAPKGALLTQSAITPTHWNVQLVGETAEQRELYRMIWVRAIASQLADARYVVRTVRLQGALPSSGKTVEFEGRSRRLIVSGWLKLVREDFTEEVDAFAKERLNFIPMLKVGQRFDVARSQLIEKTVDPPSRLTLAAFVKQLEREGIGRPGTYAAIIGSLVGCAYVRVERRCLVPTPLGELVVQALVGRFSFMELGFASAVEEEIDRIEKGQTSYRGVVSRVHGQLRHELGTTVAKHPCHECGRR